ncbi:MAG: segregation/condensation protein A [Deltaproteobacteria bacterium]|nr:MAG: segregation/condensation protein A [Deltaproteobacteria bacterium]
MSTTLLDTEAPPAAEQIPLDLGIPKPSTDEPFPTNELILHFNTFEGPIDLLLHMIKERDLDIFDIPIFEIADEFQKYVDWFQVIDLDRAGDYLAMSAELANIKSRMLLPREEDKEEDPRKELVDRLVAYQQVQSAAKFLERQQQLGWDIFKRGLEPGSDIPSLPLKRPEHVEAPDLMDLFQHLLNRRLKKTGTHQVRRGKVSVRDRIKWLTEVLTHTPQIRFTEMLELMANRPTIIVTFLALLELCRLRRIRLIQLGLQDVEIQAVGDFADLDFDNLTSFDYEKPENPDADGESEED